MEIIFLVIIFILLFVAIVLIIIFRSRGGDQFSSLEIKLHELQSSLSRIEVGLKEDFRVNREENAAIAKDNREELNNTLKNIVEQSQQT